MDKSISWIDAGREPRATPDPAFPDGIDLDVAQGKTPACSVPLPYPAARCGFYAIKCECGASAMVTTAGRPDDPRSIKLPCAKPEPPDV